jgi:Zn-dependent M28 family amino/carboxypeptidase
MRTLPRLFFGLALVVPGAATLATEPTAREARIEQALHEHTAELASDAYEGRAPGTPGEEKTLAYLVKTFKALGARPGNDGGWFQDVPITSVTTDPDTALTVAGEGYRDTLAYGTDVLPFTRRQVEQVALNESPLVFVGYGINAPERGWNDYAGIDVRGKTVVVLINDPGFATGDPALFNGRAMTYYGRWDYKFDEAARQGAAGAIIVHETEAAAYPWGVVRNSWSGANIGLTSDNANADKAAVEAWVTLDAARKLFAAAGLDYEAARTAAATPGFEALPLGDLRASIVLENTLSSTMSRNVAALLPGSDHPEEAIVYTAHWDHLGKHADEEGDNIYNGASDNASGVAGLFALAGLYGERPTPPERSILFLAVTAEESGLLGSKWYSEHPIFPPAKTVANFNMDNIAAGTIGRTRDIAVVGYGNSELEDYLARAAKAQGRVIVQEPYPEKGYYYRSDHFSLARVGIPALYLTSATDSIAHGKAWGAARLKDYTANHYHKPSDEYSPDWNLAGAAQEVMLLYLMGSELADSRAFPAWRDGVEFKAIREASLAED